MHSFGHGTKGSKRRAPKITTENSDCALFPPGLLENLSINLTPVLLEKLCLAERALGRLDSITHLLPLNALILKMNIRKEAVMSSQIEGLKSTFPHLLRFEALPPNGVPIDDIVEVSNYTDAMTIGVEGLKDSCIPSSLISDVHRRLLQSSRGRKRKPGEFVKLDLKTASHGSKSRRHTEIDASQNCFEALERFLHDETTALPTLLKIGVVHILFGSISPFSSANCRMGRVLLLLHLCGCGILKQPLLCPSGYFQMHSTEYFRLQQNVRMHGAWEEWLDFFLSAIAETASQALDTTTRIVELFERDEAHIRCMSARKKSCLQVYEIFKQTPISTVKQMVDLSGLSAPTVTSILSELEVLGIVDEGARFRSARVYRYRHYLDILCEGMDAQDID